MDRYDGKPFLRILECYVLNSIDQLDDSQREALTKMEPKMARVYQMSGSWLDIVSAQMDFPESLPGQIKDIWSKYLDQAKAQGASIDPNDFAMLFVDQNFPEAVS
jgi:hypothetical protein